MRDTSTAVDLDKSSDLDKCVDVTLPTMAHEICANIAYTCMAPTFFLVKLFSEGAYIFIEEHFYEIAANSRNFLCNRYRIPDRIVTVLPMSLSGDEYFDDGEGCTKFSESLWNNVTKYNPNFGNIPHDHVLQAKASDAHEHGVIPTYFFWRSTTRAGGKIKDLLPAPNESHRLFVKKSYSDFKKLDLTRPETSNEKYWFEFGDLDYTDTHNKGKKDN